MLTGVILKNIIPLSGYFLLFGIKLDRTVILPSEQRMSNTKHSQIGDEFTNDLPMSESAVSSFKADEMYRLAVMLRAERILYEAADFPSDKENLDAYDAGVGRILHQLTYETPICQTPEGAAQALRLVADEITESAGSFSLPVLASVLEFVKQQDDVSEFVNLSIDEAIANELSPAV